MVKNGKNYVRCVSYVVISNIILSLFYHYYVSNNEIIFPFATHFFFFLNIRFQIYNTRFFFLRKDNILIKFWNEDTNTIFIHIISFFHTYFPHHNSLWEFLNDETSFPYMIRMSRGQALIQIYTPNLSGGVISRWRQFLVLFMSKRNKRGVSWRYNDVKKKKKGELINSLWGEGVATTFSLK